MPAGAKRGLVAPQNTFLESIIRKTNQCENQFNFLLANAQLFDWPIVYANEGFCQVTGISRAEAVTRSCVCEFMHGHLTNMETIEKMRNDLEYLRQTKFELLLYDKHGTPSWYLIQIATVKNDLDCAVLFLLTFKDISHFKKPIHGPSKGKGGNRLTNFVQNLQQNKEVALEELEIITPDPGYKKNKAVEMFSLSPDTLPRYHHEAPKTPAWVILHYSVFKTIWDWFILILTFYTAIIVPYNVAFQLKNNKDNMSQEKNITWLLSDSAVDLVFLIDVFINFYTTFVGPGGEIISDRKVIGMTYIRGWFFVDVISCLPYDLVNFMVWQGDGISEEGISSLFSSLKVVRLLRLGRVARKLDHYIEYGGAMLVLLVCFFGLSGHWLACAWYKIGADNISKNGTIVPHNWLVLLGKSTGDEFYLEDGLVNGGPSLQECYIAALYFTMTSLTSVGFGNVAANTLGEQIFCILMLIFGALLYATIFGNVTTIIQQMYAVTNRYHDMLNNVREFLKLYRIPEGLSDRIMDYVISAWSLGKGIDCNKVLNYCPKDMKADVCVHLNRKVFNKHGAFRLASDSCLRALAIEFATTHNAPGDIIYHKGESVDALNFVISGSLEVIQDEEVVAILSKGDVFGDTFWVNDGIAGPSESHVRALTYCDLHSIKRESLMRVLSFYRSFAFSFSKKMVITFNLRKRYLFRKISDVQKEKEEAVQRKNDPTWEGNFKDDHPIRLLFRSDCMPLGCLGLVCSGKLQTFNACKYKERYSERRKVAATTTNAKTNYKHGVAESSKVKSSKDSSIMHQKAANSAEYKSENSAYLVVETDKIIQAVNKSTSDLQIKVDSLGKRMSTIENCLNEIIGLLRTEQKRNQNNNSNVETNQTIYNAKHSIGGSFAKSSYLDINAIDKNSTNIKRQHRLIKPASPNSTRSNDTANIFSLSNQAAETLTLRNESQQSCSSDLVIIDLETNSDSMT